MVASDSGRADYYKGIARRWAALALPTATSPSTFVDYLRQLATFTPPPAAPAVASGDLDLFRKLVMKRPEELRRRILGANVQRLNALDRRQRAALRALEVAPDLLSPLGELRYEPAHSRLLGYFLDKGKVAELAGPLLKALLNLLGASEEALEDDNLRESVVSTEVVIPGGRIDLQVESPMLLAFIEVKVDAEEGHAQLARYGTALSQRAGRREKILAFLTLPGASRPSEEAAAVHITFRQLLEEWLPLTHRDHDAAGFLARYLSSVARLLRCAGAGPFERWTFAEQRSALDLVSGIGEGGTRDDDF